MVNCINDVYIGFLKDDIVGVWFFKVDKEEFLDFFISGFYKIDMVGR